MRSLIILLLLLLGSQLIHSQQGFPLLTHFTESREGENQSWAIAQDNDNIMLFANRRGILIFDGQEWLQAPVPVVPYAMKRYGDTIYIGGEDNFGVLRKELNGRYKYTSLSGDTLPTGAITRIVPKDSLVWFCSDEAVIRFNIRQNAPDLILRSDPDNPFTGLFVTPSNTFINVFRKGLHRLDSDTLFPIVTGYLTTDVEILFSLPYNDKMVLTGWSNGNLSLFDGIKYYDYPVKDEGYISSNILSEGIAIGDSVYAFSTLDGGVVVVDKKSGNIRYTINNQAGLPDDEIFAIGSDNSGGLWMSHQYGLTRADMSFPVYDFSTYPGLSGNLSMALRHKEVLYAASSEGLFYLAEVKNYQDVQVLVKNTQTSVSSQGQPSASGGSAPAGQERQQPARRGILSKIFGGKTTQSTVTENKPQTIPEAQPVPKQSEAYVKRTVSRLRSINHVYRKVEGLNEKCRQIVSTPSGLLVATNQGLYVVNDFKARIVVADRYINSISWTDFNGSYLVSSSTGYFTVKPTQGRWLVEVPDPDFTNPVYSCVITADNTWWLGGDNRAYRSTPDGQDLIYKEYFVENEFPQRYNVAVLNDTVFLSTESSIYRYDNTSDSFTAYDFWADSNGEQSFRKPLSNSMLVMTGGRWSQVGMNTIDRQKELPVLRIFDKIVSATEGNSNIWIVSGDNRIYNIDRKKIASVTSDIDVMVKSIANSRGLRFNLPDVKFRRGDDVVVFDIVAPGYLKQNITQYQYLIDKVMDDWSEWSVQTHYEKSVRRAGKYTLRVRARDLWGNTAEAEPVNFTIRAPFTRSLVFYILCIAAVLSGFVMLIRVRERQLQIKNRILEEKVKERTAEIEAQKEEITSSIQYASRIQQAMLPGEDHFRKVFREYFILYKPRDIVSGDFYWIGEDEESIIVTVADCTGHGVPGAFMSSLGMSALNEIIANNHNLKADNVLNLLREKIKTSLHQTGKQGEAVDGMDISLCVFSKNLKTLQYAGAFNPLFVIKKNELTEYKGNSMPIGIFYGKETPFTCSEIKIAKGDCIYMFSDGFADQFGGPDGAKYKKVNLKKLLLKIHEHPMDNQLGLIRAELDSWMKGASQIDDITMIGIRI